MKPALYRPELDQLRFFAFMAVYISHALPYDTGSYLSSGFSPALAAWLGSIAMAGAFGVDLFFTLSAYLITFLLLKERQKTGRIQLKAFWLRRILRIWPLYFAFILLSQTLFRFWFEEALSPGYLLSFLLLGGNWAFAFWGPAASVAAPLWSVSIEEQFYLLWPWLLQRHGSRRRLLGLCGLLLGVATLSRALAASLDLPHVFFWCSTLTRLDPIAVGIALAVWLNGRPLILKPRTRRLAILSGLLLPVVALNSAGLAAFTGWPTLWLHPLATLASLLLLVGVLNSKDEVSRLGAFGCYLGRISYGLYVFHLLGLKLAALTAKQNWWPIPKFFGQELLLGLALTLLLASLSYAWLEQPFLRLKQRYTLIPSQPSA